MALKGNAERQSDFRARRARDGYQELRFWVPAGLVGQVQRSVLGILSGDLVLDPVQKPSRKPAEGSSRHSGSETAGDGVRVGARGQDRLDRALVRDCSKELELLLKHRTFKNPAKRNSFAARECQTVLGGLGFSRRFDDIWPLVKAKLFDL